MNYITSVPLQLFFSVGQSFTSVSQGHSVDSVVLGYWDSHRNQNIFHGSYANGNNSFSFVDSSINLYGHCECMILLFDIFISICK